MSEYGSLGETLAVAGATVAIVGAIGLGTYWLLERTSHSSDETQVDINLDDLAQLGEGVVFIGDQPCPPPGRLPGVEEGVVIEHQGGGDSGYLYAIEPVAVYQTAGPNIYCGPGSEGMGTSFEGNGLVIAGPDTRFASLD